MYLWRLVKRYSPYWRPLWLLGCWSCVLQTRLLPSLEESNPLAFSTHWTTQTCQVCVTPQEVVRGMPEWCQSSFPGTNPAAQRMSRTGHRCTRTWQRALSLRAGQDLKKISFVKGSLRRANFDGSDLSGTSMFAALLTNTSFKGANLRCAAPDFTLQRFCDFQQSWLTREQCAAERRGCASHS